MRRFILLLLLGFPFAFGAHAQSLSGTVHNNKGDLLPGANVYWAGTNRGTVTDSTGWFQLSLDGLTDPRLVTRYVGHEPDTTRIEEQSTVTIVLTESATLEEVQIEDDRPDTYISSVNPIKTEVITQTELTKAACCDLAGCFDTQGTVQPTTTNIVTNAKELRILGLSGVYNQILLDGLPMIQGLTYTYGISTIPGTLVDNIYVAKGANSVLQGFESISGQINVELKEPDETETLLLNLYANSFLETQANVNYAHKWKKWSTLVAAHTTQPARQFDRDEDNFLDLPQLTRYSFFNKWKYGNQNEWGWHSRIGLRYTNERRIGGQVNFDPQTDEGTLNAYGQTVRLSQPELYTKTGYRMNDQHHFVFFGSSFYQDQTSYFGTTQFQAQQLNAYANLQYELTWQNKHSLKTGVSFRYLNLEENISFGPDSLARTYAGNYLKQEQIPGLFAEHTFNWKDNTLALITGIRADHHNQFGWQITPRALLKYDFTENTTARVSAGTGWRTLNLFSENINLLASSRDVIVTEVLEPEKAINYGANVTHKVFGEQVEAQFSLDFYRTQFLNQIFPDYDTDPTQAYISNFTGTSISNGFQAEMGMELFERVGTKIAYNYLDVFRVIDGDKQLLPFNPKHRITGTFSFMPLTEKWHFDMNLHWYGKQRIAKTTTNPPEFQLPENSQPYTVVNAQLTKSWKLLEVYGGFENLFDFRQLRPMVSWQNPFGPYFDTSSVWGPTRGRELYLGLRFKLE